jgi:hypothetical protein
MEKLKKRSVPVLLFLLMNISLFSQEHKTKYEGSIIAGTNRLFLIFRAQQEPVKARILSIYKNEVIIKEKNGPTRKITRDQILNIQEVPFGTLGNVGVGFGIPYGTLGFNLEFNLVPYLSLTGGLGTTIFTGVGYNIGLKGYLRKPGPVWRPRISAYYGINGLSAEDFNHPDNEKYSGITAGLGQIFLWQQHGFDLDLMYIVTSGLWDEQEEGGRIKISIGYRYAF